MSSNKTVYTLDLDVNSALQNYKKLIDTLKSSGGDPKAIKDLESAMAKLESQFGSLKTEAATGFTDSKGLTKFSKGVGDISVKMQQLGTRIKDVASNAENFPNSEFAQATKEIEKINAQFENLAKTANSDLIKSLGQMGFSKEQAANIAASVKSEEDLIAKIEEERQERMKASSAAAEGFKIVKQQIASDYMSKGGKTAIFGIDLISSTIKQEFDDSEGTLEAFETLAKEHLTNALSKGIDPQNAMQSIVSFAETFESELGEGFAEAIKKSLEDAEPTISGVVSNITTKASATKEGKAYAAASSSYQAIGGPGNSFSAGADATVSSYGASMEQLNALMERATQLTSILDSKQQALLNSMNGLKSGADGANSELEQQTGAVQQDANAMANAARESEQLAASFDQMTSRIKNLLSIGTIFNTIKNVIKQTFNDVQNLDKSFASIAMVTNQTVSGLWGSYDQYAALASKLGQSTNDVVQASALFYQQGLDTVEALSLTEDTMKLATLAGNDFKTATSEMTAALRGFKMEMDEGSHVTDVYSELAAHAAASVDDIALAMQRTASIANSAGMSFENTSAFLTQMIETTQESAENIGTSMKTIIARFTELKDNVAGTADSEFDDLDFNKVDKALKSVGVSLKDTSGQFRNLDEVFLELSSKWDSLDRNTQRYVATIAAGSRQQSRFIAMMDNYDRTVELMETAADAEGKADEQFAKYADTMEYKLNQLNTTWEQFRVDLMNTDLFNPIIEKVTEFVSLVNSIDFHKFSGKMFAAEIAIMVVSIKNLIINFLKVGKNIIEAAKNIGENIAEKITKGIKDRFQKSKLGAVTKKYLSFSPELDLKILQTEEKQLINEVIETQNKAKQAVSKDSIVLKIGIDPKETNLSTQALQNLENTFQNLALSGEATEADFRSLGQQFNLNEIEIANLISKYNELKPTLDAASDASKRLAENQAQQQAKTAALAEEQKKAQSAMSLLSTGLHAGAAALAAYASGTASFGEAAKSFLLSVGSMVGSLILQNVLTAISTKLSKERAAQKLKEAEQVTAANQIETMSWSELALAEWSTLWPLLLIAVALVAVAAAAAGIIAGVKAFNNYAESLNESAEAAKKLKEAEEERDAAQERASTAKSELKDKKDELEATQSLKDEYEELTKKASLLPEEEERLVELQEEIKDQFPEIIKGYNSITGALEIHTELWNTILETQKASTKEAAKASAASEMAANQASLKAFKAQQKVDAINTKSFEDLQAQQTQADNYKTGTVVLGMLGYATGGATLIGAAATNKMANEVEIKDDQLQKMGKIFADYGLDSDTDFLKDVVSGNVEVTDAMQSAIDDYNDLVNKEAQAREDSLKAQEELIKAQTAAINKALLGDTVTYSDNISEEVQEGFNTAMGNITADESQFSKAEIGKIMGNSNILNRGYFADKLNGGIEGWNGQGYDREFTNNDLTAWDKADATMKKYITLGYGGDEEAAGKFYNDNRKKSDGIQRIFEYYKAGVTTEAVTKYGQDLIDNTSEEAMQTIANLTNNGSGLTKAEWAENIQNLKDEGVDQALIDEMEKQQRANKKAIKEVIGVETNPAKRFLKELKGETVDDENGLGAILNKSYEDFEDYSLDELSAFQDYAHNIINQAGEENRDAAEKYLQDMWNTAEKFGIGTSELLDFAQGIDWSEYNGLNAEEFEEEWVGKIQETFNMSEVEAKEFFDTLREDAENSNFTDGLTANLAQIEAYYDKVSGVAQVFKDNGEALAKYMSQGADSVSLTSAEFDELSSIMDDLVEAGVDEAANLITFNETTQDWTLNTAKLNEIMKKNGEEAIEQLEIQKKDAQEKKKAAQDRIDELETLKEEQGELTEEQEKELSDQKLSLAAEQNRIDAIDSSVDAMKSLNAQTQQYLNYLNTAVGRLETMTGKIDAMSSAFSSITSNGYLSADAIASLADAGIDVTKYAGKDLSLNSGQLYRDIIDEMKSQDMTGWTDVEKMQWLATIREAQDAYNDYLEDTADTTDDVTEAQNNYNDALEDYNDQLETVAEKQEALNEKLEAYNNLLYGSDNRKSALDYFYNYDEAINSFNDEISRAQDLLSDASSIEEATAALGRYTAATHNLIAEETAKQQVLQAGLANYADKIEHGSYSYTNQETGEVTNINFGDYARKDERTGKYVIDQRLINESRFGDEWKDLLEEQVSNYNKYSEDLLASEDNVRKAEKALRDERENALKNYVALEDKVKEVLKAEYQEQVDNLTDMYDSMKEADDDYITALQEAIEKQRELREQENAWEDLAQKEKKLSLMQRDTSGANQVETMELEEEIQEDRESLLDDAIDNIIDGLSDLYESQSELRDAELELKEALLENDAYWAGLSEATAQGFVDLDDATEWYLQHSLELTDMTAAGAESDILGFQDTYSSATEYMAMQLMDNTSETGDFINDAITVTGEEAMEIVQTTSETFTTEAQRAFNETQKTFEEDMESAEQDIKDAKDALQEAVDKLGELAAAANAAAEAYAAAKAAKNELDDITDNIWNDGDSGQQQYHNLYSLLNSGYGVDHNALDAMDDNGGDANHNMMVALLQKIGASSITVSSLKRMASDNNQTVYGFVNDVLDIDHNALDEMTRGKSGDAAIEAMIPSIKAKYKFAEGGLVDYTGPAWVDGTFNRPEAFLSADDTERIGNAAKILADIPWIDRDTDNSSVVTNNGGDVSVEINLNIDHISSDTDLDEMIERVKEEIVEVARPTGTNVILQQQL